MAVYLVKDKSFQANFNVSINPICVSVGNLAVDLRPAPNCKESEKFCSDLKSFIESNGLSEKMISVSFNESTYKIKVGGPFLKEVVKGFKESMKIQLDLELRKGENVVSKELYTPFDNPTEGDHTYAFEDKLDIKTWKTFLLFKKSSRGTITIQLLKYNRFYMIQPTIS